MISINRQWQREYRLFFVISLCDFSFVSHSLLVPRSIHALKGAFDFVAVAVAVGTVCQLLLFYSFVCARGSRTQRTLTLLLSDCGFAQSFPDDIDIFSQLSSLFIWSTLVTAGGRPSVMCASLCWANWRLV